MTGESLGQARVRADQERQTARQSHLSTADIERSYLPQILATARPPRTANSPD